MSLIRFDEVFQKEYAASAGSPLSGRSEVSSVAPSHSTNCTVMSSMHKACIYSCTAGDRRFMPWRVDNDAAANLVHAADAARTRVSDPS